MSSEESRLLDSVGGQTAAWTQLDWDKWIQRAAQEALSKPARQRVQSWAVGHAVAAGRPSGSQTTGALTLQNAQLLQAETQEMLDVLMHGAPGTSAKDANAQNTLWGGLLELEDPLPECERLARGAVLDVAALASLVRWLETVDAWASVPAHAWPTLNIPTWRRALQAMGRVRSAPKLRRLRTVLGPELGRDGEISEHASPRLAEIVRALRAARTDIERGMELLVKQYGAQGVLQESFYDQHDGRFVLPVRVSDQNKVEGAIYGTSVSRQTVYVEPESIRGANNRLKQLQNEKAQEVFKILQEVSRELAPDAEEMASAFLEVVRWDAVRARARMAWLTGAKMIHVVEAPRGDQPSTWIFKDTVHPLLMSACGSGLVDAELTRNSVTLQQKGLLLSGPNTGGKTVFLKTIALGGLFARTGFFLPGSERHTVPLIHHICIDAGDPQSIEEHRSSFSGRILQLKAILDTLEQRGPQEPALVLLDELGSATDPEEGSALARAVVEALLEKPQITLVITSHDPAVKAFALQHEQILAGGLEFDEATGQPTYRIRWGMMGRSRALETAERLGLPATLLQRAKSYLSASHLALEDGLKRLESDTQAAERLRKEAQALQHEAELASREWLERRREGVQAVVSQVRSKMKRLAQAFQDELKTLTLELTRARSTQNPNAARQVRERFDAAVENLGRQMQEELGDVGEEGVLESGPGKAGAFAPAVGDRARIKSWRLEGQLESLWETQEGPRAKVRVGDRLLDVPVSDLAPPQTLPTTKKKLERRTSFAAAFEVPSQMPSKIDLRGKRLDVAMQELEAYLDQAFRSGKLEVEVIHGLGTGALREGTLERLRALPYVEAFEDGGQHRGGAGCTVVRFSRG